MPWDKGNSVAAGALITLIATRGLSVRRALGVTGGGF